jgi:predicted ferric reductase
VEVALIAGSAGLAAWLVAGTVTAVADDRNAPWILGRASGIGAYLSLVALVGTGTLLAHPWSVRWHRPGPAARLRLHTGLAAITLAFLVLHVTVLATDPYAKVGWSGALLPMASRYRPAPVTLGVVGAWCGLTAGLTAALAGRITRRFWWPLHRAAIVCFVLVWLHGVLAGSDTTALRALYLLTAAALLVLATTRYAATSRAHRMRDRPARRPSAGGRP